MIWRAYQYLRYLLRSLGYKSPFIKELNQNIFQEKTPYYFFEDIESIRAKLLLTEKEIEILDLGAGSKINKNNRRKISDIAKTSLKSPQKAQLLFRLANHFKGNTILELGTSLGITTAYLAKSSPNAKVVTIEGAHNIAKIAEVNLRKLGVFNVKQVVSNFDQELPNQLKELEQVDFVFFDGNHKKEPTLNYFKQCLTYASENSVFVFDDIYWSKEMGEAWSEIKRHPKTKLTIDCFEMGIVFFRGNEETEHYTVYH